MFVDPRGRRARWLRVFAAASALAGCAVLVALVLGALGLGGLPGLSAVLGGPRSGAAPPPPVRTPAPAPVAATAAEEPVVEPLPAVSRPQRRPVRTVPAARHHATSGAQRQAAPVAPGSKPVTTAAPVPSAAPAPAPKAVHEPAGHATGRPAWSSAPSSTTTTATPPPGQAKDPGTPASPHADQPPPGEANGHSKT